MTSISTELADLLLQAAADLDEAYFAEPQREPCLNVALPAYLRQASALLASHEARGKALKNALQALPARQEGEAREVVARIVDEEAWAERDALDAGPFGGGYSADLSRRLDASRTKARAILAALPVEGGAVPEGFVLVPREPTREMIRLGEAAANDKRWVWCGLGERKSGEGLDGMGPCVLDAYRAMLAAAPPPDHDPQHGGWLNGRRFSPSAGARFRHVNRGTFYTLPFGQAEAMVQCSEPITDEDVLTIYIGEDGMIFARPTHEFYDGRFEPAPPAVTALSGDE